MAIIVNALDDNYRVEVVAEDEKVVFTFRQLNYRTKSLITSMITEINQGVYTLNAFMQVFYNLKYALKGVEGIEGADGKPYVLEFENADNASLTDKCVDELLATQVSDALQFTARKLSEATLPSEIVNPLTGEVVKGVTVIHSDGIRKK